MAVMPGRIDALSYSQPFMNLHPRALPRRLTLRARSGSVPRAETSQVSSEDLLQGQIGWICGASCSLVVSWLHTFRHELDVDRQQPAFHPVIVGPAARSGRPAPSSHGCALVQDLRMY